MVSSTLDALCTECRASLMWEVSSTTLPALCSLFAGSIVAKDAEVKVAAGACLDCFMGGREGGREGGRGTQVI